MYREKNDCRRADNNKCFISLAEAIILQTMEDIWDSRYITESILFFQGEGFSLCAGMAGLTAIEELRILNMMEKFYRSEKYCEKGILTKDEESYPSC
jgi:hypothetical protein